MKNFLIQGKYGGSSASWFQIVLASSIEEAKGLALLNEANIKWGEEKEIDIGPYEEEDVYKIPEKYHTEFLILIGSTEEYFRFYALDEEALLIESAIELNSSLEEINLKEFLEVYLNRELTNSETETEISPVNNTKDNTEEDKDNIIF